MFATCAGGDLLDRTSCVLRIIFSEADHDGTGTLNADEVTLFEALRP
jgi:hypothetical protein